MAVSTPPILLGKIAAMTPAIRLEIKHTIKTKGSTNAMKSCK